MGTKRLRSGSGERRRQALQLDQLKCLSAHHPAPHLNKAHARIELQRRRILRPRLHGEAIRTVPLQQRNQQRRRNAAPLAGWCDGQRCDGHATTLGAGLDTGRANQLAFNVHAEKSLSAGANVVNRTGKRREHGHAEQAGFLGVGAHLHRMDRTGNSLDSMVDGPRAQSDCSALHTGLLWQRHHLDQWPARFADDHGLTAGSLSHQCGQMGSGCGQGVGFHGLRPATGLHCGTGGGMQPTPSCLTGIAPVQTPPPPPPPAAPARRPLSARDPCRPRAASARLAGPGPGR